jgi:hypothetical protein
VVVRKCFIGILLTSIKVVETPGCGSLDEVVSAWS